jgi:hypothetical protein
MLRLPRLSNPLDQDDRAMLVRLVIYSVLVVWVALVVAVAAGLFVRIVLALI